MALILNHTFTDNGNITLDWRSHRSESPNIGTIAAYGTFGSGTVAATVSFDGGTTYMDLKNLAGTPAAISFTSNGYDNFQVMAGQNPISSQQVKIKLTLTGAATPSITVRAFDMV